MTDENQQDEHRLIAERRAKLAEIREKRVAFPSDFRRNVMAGELQAEYGEKDNEWLETNPGMASVFTGSPHRFDFRRTQSSLARNLFLS